MNELEQEEKLVKNAVANVPTGPEIRGNAKITNDGTSISQKRRRLLVYQRDCVDFALAEIKWRNNLHANEVISNQCFEDYCDAFARFIVSALEILEPARAAEATLAIVDILIKYRSRSQGLSNTLNRIGKS